MAKMFYTLAEAMEQLGTSENGVKQFSREGRLREFRDGPRLMFKADQVDSLRHSTFGMLAEPTDPVISNQQSNPLPFSLNKEPDDTVLGAELLAEITGAMSETRNATTKMVDEIRRQRDQDLDAALGGIRKILCDKTIIEKKGFSFKHAVMTVIKYGIALVVGFGAGFVIHAFLR